MKSYLAIIPARAGSKELISKNQLLFNSKPLIHWTIIAALKSKKISKIIVTSDDKKILKMKKFYQSNKIIFHNRPKKLSTSASPISNTINYYLQKNFKEYNKFILLQPTSPLRKPKHINEAINIFEKSSAVSCVSVSKIKKTKENFYKISKDNKLILNDYSTSSTNRQKFKDYYEINGAIYISLINQYLKNKTFKTNNTITYLMENKFSYDIDNKLDFKIAEFISIKNNV